MGKRLGKKKKIKKENRTNFKRTMYYFWKALMKYKGLTLLLLVLIPVNVFISDIIWSRGTSDIIGMLSNGEFEIAAYGPILMFVLIPTVFNNIVLVRILDYMDWALDARAGEYLSQLAFNAVINQSMTFHANHFSGALTSAANKLPNAFIALKSNFVWDIYPLILLVLYSLIAAFMVCPPFAAILFVFVILYVLVAILVYYKTVKYEEELAEAENKQTGQLADAVTNVMSVKSYAREEHEKKRFARVTGRTKRATFGTAKASFIRNLSLNIIGTGTFVAVLILVILSHNWFGLTISNMVFLFSISNSLLSNVWRLNHILRTVNRALGDAKEMTTILDMPYIIDDKTDVKLVTGAAVNERNGAGLTVNEEYGVDANNNKIGAEIEFSHIFFKHEGQKEELFSDFSLRVLAGESVGLVGVSGSGKSTLTKLLLRFADVEKGAIYVNGQDIRDVTQKSLREATAYVPQESSLFHRSVFENIAYGRLNAIEEEVYKAAKLARADEFIRELPEGYETLVGERGVKLSGGQRQRIAIARAILKDAPILVLDEATSALDSESEALIQEALNNLMKGRTSIVVAHRLSTVAGMDKIVVLRNGKIVEEGKHEELIRADGEYAKLWERQSGGFISA